MTADSQRCAVLYPAVAEAARRAGARAIGLIDVVPSAGPNLDVDRVGITYSDGRTLGDLASPVQLSAKVVGDQPVPATAMPEVVARVGLDRELDLAGALARVPANALPVVTATWALSRFSVEKRLRFLQRLEEADRPVAWVSIEGVGVAPSIPTLGDRPAFGHSTIGVLVSGRAEALGRCWSQGRWLEWVA